MYIPNKAPAKTYTTTLSPLKPADCLAKLKNMFWRQPKWTELEFEEKAWIKINCYCQLAGSLEITGFGKIEDGIITDIKILKQSGESAEVNVDEEAQMIFMRSIPLEEMHLWNLDWHSHVDMSAFMSTTDTKNYDKRYNLMKQSYPAMVINKRQDITCREWYGDGLHGDEIKMYIPSSLTITEEDFQAIYDQCYKDVENLVNKVTKTYTEADKGYTTYKSDNSNPKYQNSSPNYLSYTENDWENCQWNEDLQVWEVVEDNEEPPKLSKNKKKKLEKLKQKVALKKAKLLADGKHRCLACGDEIIYEIEKKHNLCTGCMSEEQLYEVQEYEQFCEEVQWDETTGVPIDYSSDTYGDEVVCCTICGQPLDWDDDEQLENGACHNCLMRYTH